MRPTCAAERRGGAKPAKPKTVTFPGANFQYLSANVTRTDTGRTVFPTVEIKKYEGVQVGFIGMTLESTPNIVTKSGVKGPRFGDEVSTANRVAKRLDRRGVKSTVVLVHEGGFPVDETADNRIVTRDVARTPEIAFMNPGGIRADLQSSAGSLTYGGTYSYSHPAGGAYTLKPETVVVNGAPIEAARTYRVVANSFMSDGGDGFAAFASYLAAHDPYAPVATDRITVPP